MYDYYDPEGQYEDEEFEIESSVSVASEPPNKRPKLDLRPTAILNPDKQAKPVKDDGTETNSSTNEHSSMDEDVDKFKQMLDKISKGERNHHWQGGGRISQTG